MFWLVGHCWYDGLYGSIYMKEPPKRTDIISHLQRCILEVIGTK